MSNEFKFLKPGKTYIVPAFDSKTQRIKSVKAEYIGFQMEGGVTLFGFYMLTKSVDDPSVIEKKPLLLDKIGPLEPQDDDFLDEQTETSLEPLRTAGRRGRPPQSETVAEEKRTQFEAKVTQEADLSKVPRRPAASVARASRMPSESENDV